MTDVKRIIFREKPKPPHVQSGNQSKIFVVSEAESLRALKYWLCTRKYNTFIESLDATGNSVFELIYDNELGVPLPRRRKERGTIAVWEKTLIKPTAKIVLEKMIVDNPYSDWWRDAQIEKYS